MLALLFSLITSPAIQEITCPIAIVENGYISNIEEIFGTWEVDDQGHFSRECRCYIPKNTPIKVGKQKFTGIVFVRQMETETMRTYIGRNKNKLILWCVLV